MTLLVRPFGCAVILLVTLTMVLAAQNGDGGLATKARINSSGDVAVDAAGNLYIADTFDNRVRKVVPSGVISTVAGTGTPGFGGDGGPAAAAQLNWPKGVAVDRTGNLYVADVNNQRIRRISTAGIISTVVGNGTAGYSGDGGSAVSAQLNLIAGFDTPQGVAVDTAGTLYIADTLNQRIRKVSPEGVIRTIAGSGQRGFGGDGGAALNAALNFPVSVTVDTAGTVYFSDANNSRVRRISPNGVINTVAGGGGQGFGGDNGAGAISKLFWPHGLAVDHGGNLLIVDSGNQRVRKLTPDGMITTIIGSGTGGFAGDGGPAVAAALSNPGGLAIDTAGNIFIGDSNNGRVRKVTLDGVISTVAGTGGAVLGGVP